MGLIDCPVAGRKIEDGLCFDICMVAEGLAPDRTLPEGIRKTEDMQKACLECKNHRD